MSPLKKLTQLLSDIAAMAIAAMMVFTIADIIMKNLFNRPIKGTFELVELMLVFVVFLGFAEVFRSDANISVDVVDHGVDERARHLLKIFGATASLGFLLLMFWAMIAPAWDTVRYPQWTQELGLPIYAYWAVIIAGTVLTIVAAAVALASLLSSQPSQPPKV